MEIDQDLKIIQVNDSNIAIFSKILIEAAGWLISRGMKNWDPSGLTTEKLIQNYNIDELFLCYKGKDAAGCLRLQPYDEMFWPEDTTGEALYVHKLAVIRKYKGKGISAFMLDWAKEQARTRGCRYLKLDCIADRKKLCMLYEKQGFTKVDERIIFGDTPSALYQFEIY